MVLLDEIKRRKMKRMERNSTPEVNGGSVSPRGENWTLPDFTHGVENPLPYFENAFREVTGLMERYCRTYGVSRAEFITEMSQRNPAGMEAFWRLHDLVDCDVYGKWCKGRLTSQDLSQFCRNINRWVEHTRSLFGTPPMATLDQTMNGRVDNG